MKVALFGGSGFIGKALQMYLRDQGWEVVPFQRKDSSAPYYWDPDRGVVKESELQSFDIYVNLAGESIMGFWTAKKKRTILESRTRSANLLQEKISGSKVFIQASAIGIYGDRGEEKVDELTLPGKGFLPEVCKAWEDSLRGLEEKGVRVLVLRIGMVLDKSGGALSKMLPLFRWGLGATLGSGNQWTSWIALQDLLCAIYFLANDPAARGVYNLTAPEPVRNKEFTRLLGSSLDRPTLFSVPAFFLKALFPGVAEELFLSSSAVYPKRLLDANFLFDFPKLSAFFLR